MIPATSRILATEAFEKALLDDDPVQLYERAPCGYLSTDSNGRIVKANQTLLTWLGHSQAELRRRSLVDLLTPGGRIYHETHYAPLLRMQGTVREIALDLVRADGSRFPVLLNARLDTAGGAEVIRIAIFDATERRQYERELLAAKEAAETSHARARTLAMTLQKTLIPPALPGIDGLELAARYHPAGDGSEVGGDFYDVFPTSAGEWVVTIGDVCGKGAEAAVVTALARYTINGLAVGTETTIRQVVAQLNDVLLAHPSGRFVSLTVGRLASRDGEWQLDLAGGGHPPGLLVRDGDVQPVLLEGALVGLFPDPELDETSVRLQPGDALVFFTDGVPEARRDREFFGDERVEEVLRPGGSADEVADRLLDAVLDFQGGVASDDVAILVLRVAG